MLENVDGETVVYIVEAGGKQLNEEYLTKKQAEDLKQKYEADGRRTTEAWIEMLLRCPHCETVQEECDCPDFYYPCGGECRDQLEILEEMQSVGFNVVNCGNCGDVFIHRIEINNTIEDEYKLVFYDNDEKIIDYIKGENYHQLENLLNEASSSKYHEAKIFCNDEEIEHRF